MAAAVFAIAAAACTTPQATPAPTAQAPVDPEAAARWATSVFDPCALLSPDVVDALEGASGPVHAASPHSCTIVGTVAGTAPATTAGVTAVPRPGARSRIVVSVGTAFGTAERAVAAPVVLGDRRAYLTRDVPAGPRARCAVDFPISPTRSVRVEAPAGDGDLVAACAAATVIAEPIGPKLATPADRTRAAVPGDLGRWSACDLIADGLGWQADRSASAGPDADTCRGEAPGSEPSVQVRLSTGPAALPAPGVGEQLVRLPAGPALEAGTPAQCTLTAIAQTLPDAPVDAAAHRITIVVREAVAEPCADAASAMGTLLTAVANGPSVVPPAPGALGYAPDAADGAPAACGVVGAVQPADCRTARPVDVPLDATALVRSASTPAGADIACMMLGTVAGPVVGELERAAAEGTGCVGLSADGFAVTVGLTGQDRTAVADRCAGAGGRPEVPVPGRTGIRCPSAPGTFDLVVPAVGVSLTDGAGALRITGRVLPPRGDRTRTPPADAEERATTLTRALADALVARYLGPG